MSCSVQVCPWSVEWNSRSSLEVGMPLASVFASTYRAQIEPSGATCAVGQLCVLSAGLILAIRYRFQVAPSSGVTYEYRCPRSLVQIAYTYGEPGRWSAAGRHQPESGRT